MAVVYDTFCDVLSSMFCSQSEFVCFVRFS